MLDLSGLVSPHFGWGEMVTTQSRSLEILDKQSNPPEQVRTNLVLFCDELLEPVRLAIGPVAVTSGYRCEELNRSIGGSPTSRHMDGLAADIHPIRGSLIEAYERIASVDLETMDQLILEFGRWIHVGGAPRNVKPRHQLLMIWEPGKYVPFDPSDVRVVSLWRTHDTANL